MVEPAHTRTGQGQTLVLLHPLGSSRSVWDPVVGALAGRFDVIAVDLPGFGESAPLPASTEATPAALAHAVARALDAEADRRRPVRRPGRRQRVGIAATHRLDFCPRPPGYAQGTGSQRGSEG
ncbi:alpha/beta fold hydrolase [Krasilnikovia sp. MM14-A1004]|uniref:alpha/beta fold hydrolase n=1 Tax=Krasilnikovia sp. MM14-A1004 TaxID=3373541 RepID=UPI00399CA468